MPISAFEMKASDFGPDGTFTGLASTYDNEDLQGDVVERGAFTRTIAERPIVKVLFNHDPSKPIGLGTLQDSAAGLILRGTLNLGSETAREVYSNLKMGILDAMSIGYDVVKQVRDGAVRRLKELKLYEVSVVTFPANPSARITSVKAGESELRVALARQAAQMQADLVELHATELTNRMRRDAALLKTGRA